MVIPVNSLIALDRFMDYTLSDITSVDDNIYKSDRLKIVVVNKIKYLEDSVNSCYSIMNRTIEGMTNHFNSTTDGSVRELYYFNNAISNLMPSTQMISATISVEENDLIVAVLSSRDVANIFSKENIPELTTTNTNDVFRIGISESCESIVRTIVSILIEDWVKLKFLI